jgi:predicted  nucleic acid-binding Zn-ribbon protein
MDMLTTESNLSAVKQTVGLRASAGADTRQLKVLCERLLRVQPQSEPLLKRLLARSRRVGSPRAFAPIQDGRCSACNMRIAIARVQQAKAGTFINCANCMRFLYFVP